MDNVATTDKYCFIAGASASDVWAKSSTPTSNTGLNVSCTVTKRIAAGGTIRMYGYAGVAVTKLKHEAGTDLVTGCTIYRAGP